MTSREYFSIVFSHELSNSEAERKKEAILNLQNYFDARPYINTGDESYFPASYATTPFLDGTINLAKTFRAKVLNAELSDKELVDVQRLGFTARAVGPHAYAFYPKPEPLEP